MRVASFVIAGRQTYGVVSSESVTEASAAFRERFPDLRSVLGKGALDELASDSGGNALSESDINYLPTIPNPDKVICVGANYRPHLEEMGHDLPKHPLIFVRFAGSQTGHRQTLLRPQASKRYDFEGELAVIVGKRAWQVPRASAYDCIAGYSCFMDGTARDWQRHSSQFTPGKNFQSSGSLGPFLVTCNEVPDPAKLTLQTRLNGEVMQQGQLSELIFDIPYLIEYLSTFAELLPGDVIATGTPGGVGAGRKPPIWLQPDDQIIVDIPGVGTLSNAVGGRALL